MTYITTISYLENCSLCLFYNFILASFLYIYVLLISTRFLQIYISVIVQGMQQVLYEHVCACYHLHSAIISTNSLTWLHTWTSLMSSVLSHCLPYCSPLSFPSRSMTRLTWKDMESTDVIINNTWRLVDTQPSIYKVEGASYTVSRLTYK